MRNSKCVAVISSRATKADAKSAIRLWQPMATTRVKHRILLHRCITRDVCGSAAHPQASDGILSDKRNEQPLFHLPRCDRRFSYDDFFFSDARPATAFRSQLPLSVPGFERYLHHRTCRSRVEGKNKRAPCNWRAADHRWDRSGLNELGQSIFALSRHRWQSLIRNRLFMRLSAVKANSVQRKRTKEKANLSARLEIKAAAARDRRLEFSQSCQQRKSMTTYILRSNRMVSSLVC